MYSTSVCALATTGRVWCWGNGTLGDGISYSSPVPVQVDTPGTFIKLGSHGGSSQGGNTDCGIKSDRTVWCWGGNNGGVGDGTTSAARPIRAAATSAGSAAFVDVSVGEERTCALTDQGVLWCWGTEITTPGQDAKSLGGTYSQVAVGFSGTICGVKTDGTLWCWKSADLGNAIQVPLACP
jgi:hypothetical protein